MSTNTPELAGRLDRDKLFAARLHAARARPYLATALFALHTVESKRVPTMAVDRHWRCYVSPAFVDRMPVEELAGVWVHEVSHLLRDHHGRGDRVARERGLTGVGDRLRMNIAADCEINDDVYGDGLVAPQGAVRPGRLRLPVGQLMEEYLSGISFGPLTLDLSWLDCGSGADGLEREWDLGSEGADGLSEQERDAVRFRVAQGIKAHPGRPRRAGGGGRRRRSIRRSRGGTCWARHFVRRSPAPARATTTATAVRLGARRGCPARCCRACDAGRPGSA